MLNTTLYWLLLVPVIVGFAHMIALRKNWREGLIVTAVSTAVGALLTVIVFYGSAASQTADIEIWNGQVVSKSREHESYTRSYDCFCREVCSGSDNSRSCSTVCQTCYEDRYTVTWSCDTTIGTYRIEHLDSTWRSVYNTPDPNRYSIIQKGDPVSKAVPYTNYVQAVPQSLFTPSSAELRQKFQNLIPAYPDGIYDFYRIDRFLTAGFMVPDAAKWNTEISMALRDLGPKKEVNLIVLAVKSNDPNYEYALRDAWQNANKNDVVVILGTPNWPSIEWARVITWSKSEIFKVELRDKMIEIGNADTSIIPVIATQIDKNFVRRSMKEFEYLKNEIDPPQWLIATLVILQVVAALVVQYVIHQNYLKGGFWRRASNFPPIRRNSKRF